LDEFWPKLKESNNEARKQTTVSESTLKRNLIYRGILKLQAERGDMPLPA
jgi:hypothetical protein